MAEKLKEIEWGNDKVQVIVTYTDDRPPAIEAIRSAGVERELPVRFSHPQSAAQITADGYLQENFGSRYSETLIGNDLRLVRQERERDEVAGTSTLRLIMHSATYGVDAVVELTACDGIGVVTATTKVTNVGKAAITLRSVSSLSTYLNVGDESAEGWRVASGRCDWWGEGRWRVERARDYELVKVFDFGSESIAGGNDISASITPYGATMTRSSQTSRSTSQVLPAGGVVDDPTGEAAFWQVEGNGAWLWQVGERVDGFYLVLSGPTDIEHHWSLPLAPGESFTTVPATLAVSDDALDGAIDEMTLYRRAVCRQHPDHETMPVIYNDYMNTLMGDPTTEAEFPLIDAAAEAGADYYVVDCGWYDDGSDWWPSVGAWQESKTRFPGGLDEVLDHIRERGMKPGIWLEPEVIGVKSPMADALPDEAFITLGGKRMQTHMRYHLDLRSAAAREYLDGVVDRLVNDHGIEFFKLDYNINSGAGSDYDTPSRGEAQRQNGLAYVAWLRGVLDRHPGLTVETCSSGAMRADPALLKESQLQSTSDQQDFRQYANIAATSPVMMLPEQCGNWAYPNDRMSVDEIRWCMVNGMVGHIYLSGYLTRMDEAQLGEVKAGITAWRRMHTDIPRAVPFWPLGLPSWNDDVVAYGERCPDVSYLAVWAKRGIDKPLTLQLTGVSADVIDAELFYGSDVEVSFDQSAKTVTVVPGPSTKPGVPCACILRLAH